MTGSIPPMKCGVGDYSYRLAQALAAEGVDVGILTSVAAKDAIGVAHLEIFPVMAAWKVRNLRSVVDVIRRFSPDVVHVQFPTQGYGRGASALVPLVAALMLKKTVQTWHEIYGLGNAFAMGRGLIGFLLKALAGDTVIVVRPDYRAALKWPYSWVVRRKSFRFIPNASAIPMAALTPEQRDASRLSYLRGQKRLIAFFGFLHPTKGVDLLFEIADPLLDHIVIAGAFDESDAYHRALRELASRPPWLGKVTFTGFIEPADAATLLGVADAVVLPFRGGGGEWNTSIHGAVLQGSFVLTTSRQPIGYNKARNIYFGRMDDSEDLSKALSKYAGYRRSTEADGDEWKNITSEHIDCYLKSGKVNVFSGR